MLLGTINGYDFHEKEYDELKREGVDVEIE